MKLYLYLFHKPTSTGLFTNFNSFLPMIYKEGLLHSLISLYFNTNSTLTSAPLISSNFKTLKQIFSCNSYPISLIDNCIRTFLTKHSRLNCLFIPAQERLFCIPYTAQDGLQICTQLHKLLSGYPHISFCFVLIACCVQI